MTSRRIAYLRLKNQYIAGIGFDRPADTVEWFGAVQAQDYLGALWAVGLRTQQATEKKIEQAIAEKSIVRTWPMRGTLHFVAARDARWMLELLTPRIVAGRANRLKKHMELDEKVFSRSKEVIGRALEGGRQMERNSIYKALEAARISTSNMRGLHILSRLAMNGFICFGAREGKQHTFALLDEWIPESRKMDREAALAELARRYFTSHGPATLQDFIWWSGLTSANAREGLGLAKARLEQEIIDDQTYWFSSYNGEVKDIAADVYILPAFDEYTVAYRDRSAVLDPLHAKQTSSGYGIFHPIIVVDGRVAGTWKRTQTRGSIVITPNLFVKISKAKTEALAEAADRYGRFLEATIELSKG